MPNKWFDDWLIERRSDGKTLSKVKVSLPHSHGNAKNVRFRKISDARVMWLISVLECALYELSEKEKAANVTK